MHSKLRVYFSNMVEFCKVSQLNLIGKLEGWDKTPKDAQKYTLRAEYRAKNDFSQTMPKAVLHKSYKIISIERTETIDIFTLENSETKKYLRRSALEIYQDKEIFEKLSVNDIHQVSYSLGEGA